MLLAPMVSDRKGEHRKSSPNWLRRASCGRASTARSSRSTRRQTWTPGANTASRRSWTGSESAPTWASDWPNLSKPRCGSGNGVARMSFAESNPREEMTFSSRHACPVCGYSVPPLEPKMFSFNNPAGACEGCDGLGYQEFFDPQRVVMHPQLSLGGRRDSRLGPAQRVLLPDDPRPGEHITGSTSKRRGTSLPRRRARWFSTAAAARRSTSAIPTRAVGPPSAHMPSRASCRIWSAVTARPSRRRCVRNLASTAARVSAPTVGGTRLNRNARHVYVGGTGAARSGPPERCRCAGPVPGTVLNGWRGEVASRIIKEVADRLALPGGRRPGLPHARPQR